MKRQFFFFFFLLLSGIFISNAQSSYQTFTNAGFKVKSDCNFRKNTTFIRMANEQGMNNVIAAYICGENTENPQIGVIRNINIYDESANYRNLELSEYPTYEEGYLDQYIRNLDDAGIDYMVKTYLGVKAIEYSFSQQGLPSKAIIFLKDKKSYLLQVGTRMDLDSKFNSLKNSFEIF